jgi:hypothetical protein
MKTSLSALIIALSALSVNADSYRQHLNLAGEWGCRLPGDSAAVSLPGTTDTNHLGTVNDRSDETTRLSRLRTFVGTAEYSRMVTIPDSWRGKSVVLRLERTKPTVVYVDGKEAGRCNDISTEQVYDLTNVLTPGQHVLKIEVDNSAKFVPEQLLGSSHAYAEDTQTNWNGIIGEMSLEARDKLHINNISTTCRTDARGFDLAVNLSEAPKTMTDVVVSIAPYGTDDFRAVSRTATSAKDFTLTFADSTLKEWSEFHPNLYVIRTEIVGHDAVEQTVGLRNFATSGKHFTINGHTTYLRGKHDACVFPLTAHTPMNFSEWQRYFRICKRYGINHVRFHSWCPPEACFLAADVEGIYLQPELPFWGDFNKDDSLLMDYLLKEGENIIRIYSHHPSFVMMALGNELWGDIPSMKRFTDDFRTVNPTILYTFGSNYYLGYQGWQEGMDYFTTCRNGGEAWGAYNTHTRGSFSFADAVDGGIINHFYPNSSMTLNEGCQSSPVPVISHETGQFQSYPDYKEIRKYYGVLYPHNLEVFRHRLDAAGMLDQADDFHLASGLWSAELYKADIELDLRTSQMAGFQLLDLQDYPGQGSAYVGILDAFMDDKEYVTPKQWRGFCSAIVPLFVTDKFCYTVGEAISGKIQLANYSEASLSNQSVSWSVINSNGDTIRTGSAVIPAENIGLTDVGNISIATDDLAAEKLTLQLTVADNTNYYSLWTFRPETDFKRLEKGIIFADSLTDDVLKKLNKGAKVLLMPDTTQFADRTVEPLFQTDYWNYRMFKTICENNKKPVSPGTLGLLIDSEHPLFGDFPTDFHSDWQWFPIVKASRSLILDSAPAGYKPIVQTIDNVERNHKLGMIFELTVGRGKLLVCMARLRDALDYPEARQLYGSILRYVQSKDFAPKQSLTIDQLKAMLNSTIDREQIDELKNISFE